jgi:ribonuclease Z
VERPRPGRFDIATARRLGVPKGPLYGALQRGELVTLPDGNTVAPDEVLGPPRPGRKIMLTGDTRAAASVLEVAREADVLVHDATFGEEERERAEETAHATATQAAELAAAAQARMLVLTHLSNRYFGPEIAREARAIFGETVVPRDFDIIDVPFPERGAPRLIKGGALGRHEEAEAGVEHGAGGADAGPDGGGGDPIDSPVSRDRIGAGGRSRAPSGRA